MLASDEYIFKPNGPEHLNPDAKNSVGLDRFEECMLELKVREDTLSGMREAVKKLRRKAREKGIEFVVNLDVRR